MDVVQTFEVFGCKLSLNRVDENNTEGRLSFELKADTVDVEKAKTFGIEWIQRNLIDSYLIVSGRYLKPEFDEPKLLNESQLVSVPRAYIVSFPMRGAIRCPLPIANVEKSLQLREKLEAHADKESLERSMRWFRKAKVADDVVDAFVMQWIALNALYGMFDPDKRGDRIAIKNLINKHPTSTEKIREILAAYDGTINKLASRGLKDWREQKNYSDELRDLIGNQDVRRTLMAVGLCLFVIRSELFHGGTMPSQDVDFIRECSQLLERIYRECFCSYVGLSKKS